MPFCEIFFSSFFYHILIIYQQMNHGMKVILKTEEFYLILIRNSEIIYAVLGYKIH